MKEKKPIYNGISSEAADFFINNIELRLDGRRPWSPTDEVAVIRAFNITLREFFNYEREVK